MKKSTKIQTKILLFTLLSALIFMPFRIIAAENPIPNQALINKISQSAPNFFKKLRYNDQDFNGKNFTFQTIDGKEVTLNDFKGKTIILALWASWCHPCRKELAALAKLRQAIPNKNLAIIALHIGNKPKKAIEFLKELNAENLTFYQDKSSKIFNQVRAKGLGFGLPIALIFDKNLDLIASYNGIIPWDSIDGQNFIHLLLNTQK